MRDSYLPYGKQWIEEDDIDAVIKVLKSDYLTTGPTIACFEQEVAEYVGAKHAVAFSNGTAALHAACFAAGVSEGDEVITTPITFAASANCIRYVGGTVVFADIKEDTYNIDPLEIERNITPMTKAIIPVHFTGQPVQLDEIHAIAKKHNLIVIEDAAHALGAEYKGKKIEGFNINFNEFVYDYEIKVNDLDKLNIIYETSSPYSTVKVSGDIILNEGENNINIKVTSGNGKNSTIYKK